MRLMVACLPMYLSGGYMRLGERVERLRIERDLSLNELARWADMTSGQLSNLERGLFSHTSVYVVRRLADALGVTLDELMDGVTDPPPRRGVVHRPGR